MQGTEGYLACSCGGCAWRQRLSTTWVMLQLLSMCPPLCRKWSMEEEESCSDGVLACSLGLHLCTGTRSCSQTQKDVPSQWECDLAEKMVVGKRRRYRLGQGHAKQQPFFFRQSTNKLPTVNPTSQADFLARTQIQAGIC